jgi:hypothetical protein
MKARILTAHRPGLSGTMAPAYAEFAWIGAVWIGSGAHLELLVVEPRAFSLSSGWGGA